MDYEEQCEEILETNKALMALFEQDLRQAQLKDGTIGRHLMNVDLFINDYLLYTDATPMKEGIYQIGDFLGDYFIRKCMWSTPASIKSTAASIKKFYKSMLAHGKIEKADYRILCELIKDGMIGWQAYCAVYNNPDYDDEDFYL